MFALTDEDLSGSIRDCPGGAASFAAETHQRRASVVAVDPVYAAPTDWLAEHAIEEAVRSNRHTGSSPDSFVWSFVTDITDHLNRRKTAAEKFGHDLAARPGRSNL